MIYGYARVSTPKQRLKRQEDNIKEGYPEAIIFSEEFTGTTEDRPQWNKLKSILKPGDTVIFDEVSRMSRNAEEGYETYQRLYDQGINLVFLKERHMDTDVFRETLQNKVQLTGTDVDVILRGVNEYLMILAKRQIEIAFEASQHEVDHLHQRTSDGVRQAIRRYDEEEIKGLKHQKKRPGGQKGSKITTEKSKRAKQIIRTHAKAYGGSLTDTELLKLIGCSRNSLYKYKRELRGLQ